MRKARMIAIFGLLIFLALMAGGVYMAIFGVGEKGTGKAEKQPAHPAPVRSGRCADW